MCTCFARLKKGIPHPPRCLRPERQAREWKVGQLLKCMGIDCVNIYDSFEWAPAMASVDVDPDNYWALHI